jgi:RimJ/RimL family protein N-acetyltransferase
MLTCYCIFAMTPPVEPLLIEVRTALQGERVLVRPLLDSDASGVFQAIDESRTYLMPWMPWAESHRSIEDSLRYIRQSQAQWILRERLPVGIFDIDIGTFVGGSGLERIDWQLRRFEIGYWLRADAQGHGYVQETVQLLTRLAFDDLAANRVEIRMDPRNDRSERVAKRLGFVFEGTLRNSMFDHATGGPADRHIYALTPETYARLPWGTPARR